MDDVAKKPNDRTDRSIEHGSYSIKRCGGQMRLNDNDSEFDDDKTEVAVAATNDDIGSPEGVLLQATFKNGAYMDAYTGLTMTPTQARSIAERLQRAADAFENDEDYWER